MREMWKDKRGSFSHDSENRPIVSELQLDEGMLILRVVKTSDDYYLGTVTGTEDMLDEVDGYSQLVSQAQIKAEQLAADILRQMLSDLGIADQVLTA